jgi:hypothetical protein
VFADIDGDGLLDRVSESAPYDLHGVEVRYGPSERWAGAPDLVVAPSCQVNSGWYQGYLSGFPDVTGDGVREVWFNGYDYVHFGDTLTCARFVFGLPEGPTYDPWAELAPDRMPLFEVVPDQTGDGELDLFVYGEFEGVTLVPGPVHFDSGGITSQDGEAVALPNKLRYIRPIPVDLDGDGYDEFVDPYGWTLYYGGADRLIHAEKGRHLWGYDIPDGFAEDGWWSTLVPAQSGIEVVGVAQIQP